RIRAMWNMTREGFKQLYDLLPGEKPPFDDVWKWTGGNPEALDELYRAGWDVDAVVRGLLLERGLGRFVEGLSDEGRQILEKALDDPDVLLKEIRRAGELIERLIELNLLSEVYELRDQRFWLDAPPPERDPEIGVGKYYAWQTPLHREAVRRALGR
ncbi:MAG: ATP-binding protein, partial [Pyrobaculum sp.]